MPPPSSATSALTIREATIDDASIIIAFEQMLALETEGIHLDEASVRRGVEIPLRKKYLAKMFLAEVPEQYCEKKQKGARSFAVDDEVVSTPSNTNNYETPDLGAAAMMMSTTASSMSSATTASPTTTTTTTATAHTPNTPQPSSSSPSASSIDSSSTKMTTHNVVGFLSCGMSWCCTRGGFIYYILSVFITPAFRGRGVFRHLYKHVHERLCRDPAHFTAGVRLYVDDNLPRAHRTYEKLGMAKESLEMWKWMKDENENENENARQPQHQLVKSKTESGDDDAKTVSTRRSASPPPRPTAALRPLLTPWKIRAAEAADLPQVVEMIYSSVRAERYFHQEEAQQQQQQRQSSSSMPSAASEADIVVDEAAIRRGVAAAWAQPDELSQIFVAEISEHVPSSKSRDGSFFSVNRIIGLITVSREWQEWRGGVILWTEQIYVIPEMRKHGVFRSLFEFVKKKVIEDEHLIGIRMLSVAGNEVQAHLARSSGLTKEHYTLMKSL